jgi:subtilisin family serine protease
MYWYDAVTGTQNPYDTWWHGTHISSILVGSDPECMGVAPEADLIVINCFQPVAGELPRTSQERIAENLAWVLGQVTNFGIRVVSMSIGSQTGRDGTGAMSVACDNLVRSGVVVVVAAGNEDADQSITAPGTARLVLTVGSCDADGVMTADSSRGPTTDGRSKPDLVAPGLGILGADGTTNEKYLAMNGTSVATPLVSGLVALLLEKYPTLSPAQVKQYLLLGARPATNAASPLRFPNPESGWGLPQLGPVVELLSKSASEDPLNDPQWGLRCALDDTYNGSGIALFPINLTGGHHYSFVARGTGAVVQVFHPEPNAFHEPRLLAAKYASGLGESFSFTPDVTGTYVFAFKSMPGAGPAEVEVQLGSDAFFLRVLVVGTPLALVAVASLLKVAIGPRTRRPGEKAQGI